MRVITCQEKDELVIGENIRVEIVEIFENRVLLGFSSPDQIPSYWEEELYLSGQEELEFSLEPQYVSWVIPSQTSFWMAFRLKFCPDDEFSIPFHLSCAGFSLKTG